MDPRVRIEYLILIFSALLQTGESTCTAGIYRHHFGTDCKLQCHCEDQNEVCDEFTGACVSGCQRGWTGPGCQYENIALETSTEGVSGLSDVRITNGQRKECTSQNGVISNPYVTLTLEQNHDISDIMVFFGDNADMSAFEVYIGESTSRNTNTLCYRREGGDGSDTNRQVHVQCSQVRIGRYVTVVLPGSRVMDICEIEVLGDRALEYNQLTNQSTTLGDIWAPGNAVDGGTDRWAHTWDSGGDELTDPWWYVDLGGPKRISKVVIFNREGDLGNRLLNFKVYISSSDSFDDKTLIHHDTSSPPELKTIINVDKLLGRYVRVELEGENRVLTLLQVMVFGACPDGLCGFQCQVGCHCTDNYRPVMRELNGTCAGPCKRGWTGSSGYCSTSECPSGRFGYECHYLCHCEGPCDPWTGECLPGGRCSTSWTGGTCQAYNTIYRSLITAEGNTSYTSASATVDGNVRTCGAVLAGQRATWTSPFSSPRLVDQIMVYVNDITSIFDIEITTENDVDFTRCEVTGASSEGAILARCGNFNATNMRIRTQSVMQICEVQVLECADGTFGERCEKICNCEDYKPCNKTTGVCPSQICLAGYTGFRCDEECRAGFYGVGCTELCGNCKDGESCDPVSGLCSSGCAAGWRGSTCKEECQAGKYGEGCNLNCGQCLSGEPCNKVYGTCQDGCSAGYQGVLCKTECDAGRYGINCEGTCGECSQSAACDRRTGDCTVGCTTGYQPPLCQTDCMFGTYGNGCSSKCGACRNNVTCNKATGVCDGGCGPGVYFSSLCNQECIDGRYGYNCADECIQNVCKDANTCSKVTGGCPNGCKDSGKQPPFCIIDCNNGTFGQNCENSCGACRDGASCDPVTGECPDGCDRGFTGAMCASVALGLAGNDGGLSDGAVIAIVCVLAGLGILAFIIVVIICRRRRNPRVLDTAEEKSKKKSKSKDFDNNINVALEAEISDKLRNVPSYKSTSDKRPTNIPRGSIAVVDLWDYMHEKKAKRAELYQQFKELASGLVHPCETARKAQNIRKNRYKEVYAYDHSRVKLDPWPDDMGNDYINASFINGYNRPHAYIAAQGPTDDLVNDFWRMVWQKKCRKIVMLTRLVEEGQVKSGRYWPDDGGIQYGSVSVMLVNTEPYADYSIRTLKVTVGKERREIKHFQYTAWPDRDVPQYASSVVEFWIKVRSTEPKDNVPTVVHCSAGLGRTGAFLALDYLVDQANVEGYVNIFKCVESLRNQRVNMVQTQNQYVFLHEALVEALMCPSHVTPCEKFPAAYRKLQEVDPKSRRSKLEAEFEKLNHVTRFLESQRMDFYLTSEYKAARSEENRDKNRTTAIIPAESYRPKLVTKVFDRKDYINAVYLPSYREDKHFLLTQNPLPDTNIDFWRLVYEHDVTTIVCLEPCKRKNEVYWPMDGETMTFVPFQLHHVKEEDHITYIERTIKLLNAEEPHERTRTIKQFECRFWTEGKAVPDDHVTFLSFHDQVQKWHRQTGNTSIVVHCMNGADRSGLYCVLSAVIERLKLERDVAISQTLKQMRVRRQQIVPNIEQYKFCHDAVAEFLRGFDTYSNFFI